MCGIAGICDHKGVITSEGLNQLINPILHRGPDDSGLEFGEINGATVGLAFRRLSIIDTSSLGHQPMSNEDGSVWIVFNGEIYNYQDLRAQLTSKGYTFRSQSDTEIIINLYMEYGEKAIEHLRGMFALVIWDKRNQTFLCARDPFGIKPFYYYHDENHFIFGSEIKSIKTVPNIDLSIDVLSIDSYFAYGYIPGEASIYSRIKKLLPGHTITYDLVKKTLSQKTYWSINFSPDNTPTESQWCDELEETLAESVKSHMISDVPLGAFLSGGLDSSSVVALMSRYSDVPIKTFSIGFNEPDYDEREYARAVSQQYGTEHHELVLEPDSIGLLSTLAQAYDEPFADASAIPTYYLSKFAREHVTVALSGDGGDELFAGYSGYVRTRKLNQFNFPVALMRKIFWGSIYRFYPDTFKGKEMLYTLSMSKRQMPFYRPAWSRPERLQLYSPSLREAAIADPAEERLQSFIGESNAPDYLSMQLETTMRTSMVDSILTKVDRASMQHSLEVRVPFLDKKVAELAFRIPSKYKLNGDEGKYIFRKTMRPHLPSEVMDHPKQGFNVPMKYWFKESLYDYLNDRFTSNSKSAEYISPIKIQEMIENHKSGYRNFSNRLWAVLFFDEWMEQQS